MLFFFVKQKTAYELRISDWSSDVCSSDLLVERDHLVLRLFGEVLDGALEQVDLGRPAQGFEFGSITLRAQLFVPGQTFGPTGSPVPLGRASCRESGCQYV